MPEAIVLTTQRIRPAFSENALTVLGKRYLLPDETPDGLIERVSFGNADYYDMLARLDFLPNSPTLFNAGTDQGTLSACFKFDVPDSMDGIMDVARKAAMVLKFGGGVGYTLSALRPHGAPVRTTHKVAGGPVQFMGLYHAVAMSITQGGKRAGAQMAILHCDHPDIEEFINAKATEAKAETLTTFNISVAATDAFMHDAINVPGSEPARLFALMTENAWRTGDPGCYFIDAAERHNPTPWLGQLTGTNPCVTGDTMILTRQGQRPIQDLVGQPTEVWNGDEWSLVIPEQTGQNQPILRVRLTNGLYIDCTPYHGFYRKDGTKIEARHLKPGDQLEKLALSIQPNPGANAYTRAYLAGFYAGDGFYDNYHRRAAINFCGTEKIAIGRELERQGLIKLRRFNEEQDSQRGYLLGEYDKTAVPLDAEPRERLEWLAGLLDSDGCVAFNGKGKDNYAYQISSINRRFLRQTLLLCQSLGATGAIGLMTTGGGKPMPGGIYDTQDCYRLTLASTQVVNLLAMGLPVQRLYKGPNNPQRSAGRYPTVESVKRRPNADVYCFTEPLRHRGVFNGILTAQCGEVPLLDNEPCNLGSIHLAHMFNPNNLADGLDWQWLKHTARLATRYLDDVLDHNQFPDPAITDAALTTRKLGLGVMGWADLLCLLNIPYDSQSAVDLGAEIMRTINETANEESIALAHSKGVAPAYAHPSAPAALLPDYLPRNVTRTCIAPTGTISILADASSGIEPHFALQTTRRMGNHGETILVQNIPVLERSGGFAPKTTNEIGLEWHVKHQAAFQQHTDLAVSKTINLPNSATIADIRRAYALAWESECKGITVFRDGCRNSQVLTADQPANVPDAKEPPSIFAGVSLPPTGPRALIGQLLDAIKPDGIKPGSESTMAAVGEYIHSADMADLPALYPEELPPTLAGRSHLPDERQSITHKFTVADQEGYLTVGLYPDKTPGEIFITCNKTGTTVSGLLDAWAISISRALQHGVPFDELIPKFVGLRFEPAGMTGNRAIPTATSIVDYIARWLILKFNSPIMATQPMQDTGLLCPDCGSKAIAYEGCLRCVNDACGWERCG